MDKDEIQGQPSTIVFFHTTFLELVELGHTLALDYLLPEADLLMDIVACVCSAMH